jgi:hypothetical protein
MALTALIGRWLLARADWAIKVTVLQDLGPVDDAIALSRLVAVVAEAPWAVVAGNQTATSQAPEAGTRARRTWDKTLLSPYE